MHNQLHTESHRPSFHLATITSIHTANLIWSVAFTSVARLIIITLRFSKWRRTLMQADMIKTTIITLVHVQTSRVRGSAIKQAKHANCHADGGSKHKISHFFHHFPLLVKFKKTDTLANNAKYPALKPHNNNHHWMMKLRSIERSVVAQNPLFKN